MNNEPITVVMSGENATVHSVVYLTEALRHAVDGNACLFSETRRNLNEYFNKRIEDEQKNRGRIHKKKRIRVLKSLKAYVDNSNKDFCV